MKKRRLTALVAAVLLLTMVPMWPTGAQTVWVYTKNGKTLNLRDEYTNKVIGHIPYGTKLETDPNHPERIKTVWGTGYILEEK